MTVRTKIIIIIFLLLLMLGGLFLVAYPILSEKYYEVHHSEIVVDYEQEMQKKDNAELLAALEAANAYNEALFKGEIQAIEFEQNGYFDLLDLSGNGIMGYVEIPCIAVKLPIYHGVSDSVLQKGAGHLPPTSLPVGGINTHATISAHSGMASQKMFTELELMKIGDIFCVHILGESLYYQVEYINNRVEPNDVTELQIQRGRDLVTLLTCTPVGVNTHRLVVRGERIEKPEEEITATAPITQEPKESVFYTMYMDGLILSLKLAIIPLILTIIAMVVIIRRRKQKTA